MGTFIRFVGGPKHNELLCVTLRPVYEFVAVPPVTAKWSVSSSPITAEKYRSERYYLHRFYTEHQTIYSQYVHESLLRGCDPVPQTYSEDLPEMDFDPTLLLLMLAKRQRVW